MQREQSLRLRAQEKVESQRSTWFSFAARLGRDELDFIEEVRNKNRKGDVDFSIRLTVHTLVLQNNTLPFTVAGDQKALAANREGPLVALVEKVGEGGFAQIITQTTDGSHRIPANDWLHDYAPRLRIGSFVVCEIPQPPAEGGEIGKHLEKAMGAISRAKDCLLTGDWCGVTKELRIAWEPLRSNQSLKDLLKQDGYDEAAAKAFDAALGSLFDLASKFSHAMERDRVTVRPDLIAQKEDAYLVYCNTLAVLNLVARKAKRLGVSL